MLENFDFFIVALALALQSAQNLLKKIISASQLDTSEIWTEMGPATLGPIPTRLNDLDFIFLIYRLEVFA